LSQPQTCSFGAPAQLVGFLRQTPAVEQTPQAAKPEPLPRSLSLVPAEWLQGAHGQAILMLRGIEP